MGIFNLKSSFFIATFASQMRDMFYAPTADALSQTFNIAFPVGGFFTSVIASLLLERLGDREDLYLTLVLLLAIMFGIYNLLPYAASQFAAALLFGPTRTLQWATYFHFLSLPRRYPPQFVGRLLGYGNLVIALIGDVPLSALNAFVLYTDTLGSSAARYLLVHFLLQIALIGCLALPWYLHKQHVVSRAAAGPLPEANAGDDEILGDDDPPPRQRPRPLESKPQAGVELGSVRAAGVSDSGGGAVEVADVPVSPAAEPPPPAQSAPRRVESDMD